MNAKKKMIFRIVLVLITGSVIVSVCASSNEGGVIFPPLPVSVTNSTNAICEKHSETYRIQLQNLTLWAEEMWDATAKSATGLLKGSRFQMGHYEECLASKAPFRTQYCLTNIRANIPKPKQPRDPISLEHDPNENVVDRLYPSGDRSQQDRNMVQMGWCVPASCSAGELQEFLNPYLNEANVPLKAENVTFSATILDIFCHSFEEINLTSADITFCTLTLILVLLVILTTFYDFYRVKREKPVREPLIYKLIISFSARRNFNNLTRKDESDNALTILYGMKTICIMCIILDHRFGTFTSSALLNFDYVEQQYRAQLAPFLFHGDLFVDSFFLFSGLLVSYGLLGTFSKRKMNPGFIILLRYIRLTPVYAFVIFYYATVFNYTGSGPLWKVIAGQDAQDCKDNWWTNLLYINNYVNADHMCMTHAWYLPCDFHYFIIGIGVCLLINKSRKAGLSLLLTLIIISVIIPFVLTIVYQRPALLHFYPEFLTGPKMHPDFLLTYSKSHTRASPYFVGMFAGYIYHKLKGTDKHVCRVKSHSILFVSIFLIVVSIVGGAVFYNPYHPYNAIEAAAYAGLHRPAFALGSIGILYVSSYGHASFIYNILSWKPWIPLSKLTYGAYLIHLQFQLRSAAKFMNPMKISYFDVISLGLSDIVLAFVASLGLYLTIEAPLRIIFRHLLTPPKDSKENNNTEMTVTENPIIGTLNSSRL